MTNLRGYCIMKMTEPRFYLQPFSIKVMILDDRVKVLGVDDQYVARSFFEIYVQMAKKYDLVASLSSAEQAIAYCMDHPVDLAIMDVLMKTSLDGLTCAGPSSRTALP